jgi:hypothetical protein
MNFRIYFFLSSCFFLTYCTNKESYSNVHYSIEKTIGKIDENQVVVVIPNQGCDGCISVAEKFVKNNFRKHTNLKIIFTKIHSRKLLKFHLGDSIINNSAVFLDTIDQVKYPNLESEIYPMIVYYEQSCIAKIDFQSPNSDGFKNFYQYEEK